MARPVWGAARKANAINAISTSFFMFNISYELWLLYVVLAYMGLDRHRGFNLKVF